MQLLGKHLFKLFITHCVEFVFARLEIVFELVYFPEWMLVPGGLDHASKQWPRAEKFFNADQEFILAILALHFY